MGRLIRVGSRESRLAVIQARLVIDAVRQRSPELDFELVTMKTTGDVILDRNLDEVGGKGLFVKELDRALFDGKIDIAVHSLKDMPMVTPDELPIVSYTRRENPFDALVLPEGKSTVDPSKPFGCSSARRKLQLQRLYPGAAVRGIRGNVTSRLAKVDGGEYAATVLACAGLNRMGLQGRITKIFAENEMVPASGQGILAVQGRKGDDVGYLSCVNDVQSQLAAMAERAFVRRLGGNCSSPIAAYAAVSGRKIRLHGLYCDESSGRYAEDTMEMNAGEAEELGYALADRLRQSLR